ncbi:MAG: DUF3738 domain-containing protein [Candidatus Acidiferrales bacterium]
MQTKGCATRPAAYLTPPAPGSDTAPLPVNAPPIEKAIEDQLGLKLASTTGSMEFIVIDHAERPTPN